MGKEGTGSAAAAPSSKKRQRNSAGSACSSASSTSTVDWARSFPAAHIKNTVRAQQQGGVGGAVLQPATELITACSALFVRDLVRRSGGGGDLSQLRRAIRTDPDLELLRGVLDGLEDEVAQEKGTGSGLLSPAELGPKRCKAAAPAKKKKQPPSSRRDDKKPKSATSGVEEALQVAGDPMALGISMSSSSRQKVVLDEEDYD